MHAHEKLAGAAVAELRGVEDIGAEIEQKSLHGMHDSRPVGARQLQVETMFGRHDLSSFV